MALKSPEPVKDVKEQLIVEHMDGVRFYKWQKNAILSIYEELSSFKSVYKIFIIYGKERSGKTFFIENVKEILEVCYFFTI